MAIIGEVSDALAAVARTIDNIRTISEAVESGRNYITTKHPQVAHDLAAMCEEMRRSALALASASRIVTNFSFVLGEEQGRSARDFNRELVAHKEEAEKVEQAIDSMRGHCSVVRHHAEAIRAGIGTSAFDSVAAFLGLHSSKREGEIAAALDGIYDEEMQYHYGVHAMAEAIRAALDDVRRTLGPPAAFDPARVPAAAALLGEYAGAFSELERRCRYLASDLAASIEALELGAARS